MFEVLVQNENIVELSFKKLWDKSQVGTWLVPLNIDKRSIISVPKFVVDLATLSY